MDYNKHRKSWPSYFIREKQYHKKIWLLINQNDEGLPWWLRWLRICLQWGRPRFDPWVGRVPWRRAWQPIPIFWPGESPCTEVPGRLQSMELQRVGHDWATKHIQNDKNLKEQQYYELMRKWIDWNFHTPPVTMQNGAAALENSLAISQKIKHKLTILSRNSTPRIWLKINGKKMSTQWLAHRCL